MAATAGARLRFLARGFLLRAAAAGAAGEPPVTVATERAAVALVARTPGLEPLRVLAVMAFLAGTAVTLRGLPAAAVVVV